MPALTKADLEQALEEIVIALTGIDDPDDAWVSLQGDRTIAERIEDLRNSATKKAKEHVFADVEPTEKVT